MVTPDISHTPIRPRSTLTYTLPRKSGSLHLRIPFNPRFMCRIFREVLRFKARHSFSTGNIIFNGSNSLVVQFRDAN